MQKLFYVGIGIFLCILFVTTKYGLGMTQNDLILEEDSKKYLKNQIAGKVFLKDKMLFGLQWSTK